MHIKERLSQGVATLLLLSESLSHKALSIPSARTLLYNLPL